MLRVIFNVSFLSLLFLYSQIGNAKDQITVGVFENKPIVYKLADDTIGGLSISILDKIAASEKWKIEYVYSDFKDIFNRLKRNEIDLIVGLAYTEPRAKSLFYTNETLINNWGVVYQPVDGKINSIQDLKNKRIVEVENNIHSLVFRSLMNRFGFSYQSVYVTTPHDVLDVLKKGKADAAIINRMASLNVTKSDKLKASSIIFNPVEVRYASSKNSNQYIVKKIDQYLSRWKNNEGSIYYQQLDRWVDNVEEESSNTLTYILVLFTVISLLIVIYIPFIKTAARRDKNKLTVKSEEQILILSNLIDGAILIDKKGIVHYMNPSANEMFQYSSKEVVGKNIKMLMPESTATHHDGYLVDYIKKPRVSVVGKAREVMAKRKDNEVFPMQLTVVELPSNEGDNIRFLGTCIDLSFQKKQEKYVHRSQKMDALGQLTGGIAHDYNNMLGVILGFSELINEKAGKDDQVKLYIEQILKAADRGVSLTKKLLTFSRSSDTDKEVIDLNEIIREESLMLEKTLTPRIKLILDLQEEIDSIFVDRSELIESIVNMAINAMHAMPDGGSLTIRTDKINCDDEKLQFIDSVKGECIHLSLTDTGHGMTEEQQIRVFEPFYSTKGDGGNGLGLSQVYGFVADQGGAIDVHSKIGLGTCFDIYFPISQSEETGKQISDDVQPVNTNKTVLVVDDEESITILVKELLSDLGYRVLTATNGEEVLKLLDNTRIDLLLSDIIMPDIDGYVLAKKVIEKHSNVKIQLMSGYSNIKGKNDLPDDLIKNILQKPFTSNELVRKVCLNFEKK